MDLETINSKGMVNEPCARSMARGARQALKADWGLSITGAAGPDPGSKGAPVGLVAFGLSSAAEENSCLKRFSGAGGRRRFASSPLFLPGIFGFRAGIPQNRENSLSARTAVSGRQRPGAAARPPQQQTAHSSGQACHSAERRERPPGRPSNKQPIPLDKLVTPRSAGSGRQAAPANKPRRVINFEIFKIFLDFFGPSQAKLTGHQEKRLCGFGGSFSGNSRRGRNQKEQLRRGLWLQHWKTKKTKKGAGRWN